MPKQCPKCAREISDINELLTSPLDNIARCHLCEIVREYYNYENLEGEENEV